MDEAKLYHSSNSLQRRDAEQILMEFSDKLSWKEGDESVLDIGSGDGGVTVSLLKPLLPRSVRQLTGCDVSHEMVKFANEHYMDETTSFRVLDIAKELDSAMTDQYDHIFSFYTLHWVQDQRQAVTNIYDLLKNSGDCLLVFLASMPIFDIYKTLSQNVKWSPYMTDVDKFISPYQFSEAPGEDFERLLKECGFSTVRVQCRKMEFVYEGIDMLRKAVKSVNPFYARMSSDLHEEFFMDYLDCVRELGTVKETNNNEGETARIVTDYTLMIAHGIK